jgi:hypothetical protein
MDTQAPKPDTLHPAYPMLQTKRDDYAAVKNGTDAIRATKEKCLKRYPKEFDGDYKNRLDTATIDGLVAIGVDTLCGKVFDDEIDVSKVRLDPKWLENFDNEGTSFNEFARESFESSFDGFSLIIADLPSDTATSKELKATLGAEADRLLNFRPFARLYTASSVINWHYETNPTTQIKELTLLVLKEQTEVLVNRFERKTVTRYRVYTLENGVVTWELFEEIQNKDRQKSFVIIGAGVVSNVKQIPAAFIGCVTDEPKLLGESRLEIKAYQKESSFDTIEYLSVPVFFTKGYPPEEPSPALGASAHLRLPGTPDAEAGYIQIDATGHDSLKSTFTGIKDTIKNRISQMADPVNRAVEITATESSAQSKDKQARLIVWANELKDALERALQFMAQLAGMGDDAGGEIILNTAWERAAMEAEERKQLDLETHKATVAAMGAKATK